MTRGFEVKLSSTLVTYRTTCDHLHFVVHIISNCVQHLVPLERLLGLKERNGGRTVGVPKRSTSHHPRLAGRLKGLLYAMQKKLNRPLEHFDHVDGNLCCDVVN